MTFITLIGCKNKVLKKQSEITLNNAVFYATKIDKTNDSLLKILSKENEKIFEIEPIEKSTSEFEIRIRTYYENYDFFYVEKIDQKKTNAQLFYCQEFKRNDSFFLFKKKVSNYLGNQSLNDLFNIDSLKNGIYSNSANTVNVNWRTAFVKPIYFIQIKKLTKIREIYYEFPLNRIRDTSFLANYILKGINEIERKCNFKFDMEKEF